MVQEKKTILFICTHNSARSQIAEAIVNKLYGDRYSGYSAGTEPTKVNPYAVKVLKEIGIDISKNRSKHVNEFKDMKFDYVVTVCDSAKETCPFHPAGKKIIHKSFPNPAEFHGSDEEKTKLFRRLRDDIKEWIVEVFKDLDRF